MLYFAALLLLLLLPACTPGNCPYVASGSDTSQGTYTYSVSDAPQKGTTTMTGSVSATGQALSVSAGSSGGLSVDITFNSTLAGVTQQVDATLTVLSVPNGGSSAVGPGSTLCLDDGSTCYPLTGTISTTNYSTDCGGADGPCAVVISGTLDATSSWGGGSFHASLTLDHADTLQNETCQTEGS
jgi:hypothetical protein